jgi:hypothetical protein
MKKNEKQLRECEPKATPGPWCTTGCGVLGETSVRRMSDDELVLTSCSYDREHVEANAQFAAAARNAVPEMLTELDQLRAALTVWRNAYKAERSARASWDGRGTKPWYDLLDTWRDSQRALAEAEAELLQIAECLPQGK